MNQTRIQTTFVADTVAIGLADAVDAAESLVGTEIGTGPVRLLVKEHSGAGIGGAVWFSGLLRTGSAVVPSVRVDVVVSPWSAYRSEIGIRPLARLGGPESLRTARFLDAAWKVMPQLAARMTEAVAAAGRETVPALQNAA